MANQNPFLQSPFQALIDQQNQPAPMPGSDPVKEVEIPEMEAAAVEQAPAPVVKAAAPKRAKSSKPQSLAPPEELRPLFATTAEHFGVPENILMAIAQQESGYSNGAVNGESGASGMVQYMDATAKSLGINKFDPNESIPAAALQIRERLDKGMSMEDAVKEHFAGPNRDLWKDKTHAYGKEVLEKAEKIDRELYGNPAKAPEPEKQNGFAPDRMARAEYEANFKAMNPQAKPAALSAVMAQYDEQAKARTKAKGNAVQDRFATLQSPEAMFDAKLNAKLQGGNKGVAQALPDRQQPVDVNSVARKKPGVMEQAGDDFGRGVDNLKALGYGAAGLAADASGNDEAADRFLTEYVAIQDDIAKNNPATIGTYKNVGSLGDAGRYAIEAVMENLPMMLPSLVSGGVGAQIAKKGAERLVGGMIESQVAKGVAREVAEQQAAKFVVKRITLGSVAGAAPASVGMESGSIMGDIYQETGEKRSGLALAAGIPAGLLDTLQPVMALRKIAGPIVDDVAGGIVKRLGVEGAKQFMAEAGTEGLQTIIEQAAAAKAANRDLMTPELMDNVIDAMLKGGIGGVVIGGASQGINEARRAIISQADPATQAADAARANALDRWNTNGLTRPAAPSGPLEGALQSASVQDDADQWTAEVMGDDGLMHRVDSRTGVEMTEPAPSGPLESAVADAAELHALDPAPAPMQPEPEPAAPDYSAMPMEDLRARLKEVAAQAKASPEALKALAPERKQIEQAVAAKVKQAKQESKPAEAPLSTGPFDDIKQANREMIRHIEAKGVAYQVVESKGKFNVAPLEEASNGNLGLDNPGTVGRLDGVGRSGANAAGLADGDGVRLAGNGNQPVKPRANDGKRLRDVQPDSADATRAADAQPALTDTRPAENPYRTQEFPNSAKAEAFVAKKGIDLDAFEVVQTGEVRWQVLPRLPKADAKKAIEPVNLVRMSNAEDFDWNRAKPNGTYASIADDVDNFASPFADDYPSGKRHDKKYQPKNPLVVGELRVKHARFKGIPSMSGPSSAGVKALHAYLPQEQFNAALKMSKAEVQAEIASRFPDVDSSTAYDSYEALEIWGAQEAKAKGHDIIIARDGNSHAFSEAVLLEGANSKPTAKESANVSERAKVSEEAPTASGKEGKKQADRPAAKAAEPAARADAAPAAPAVKPKRKLSSREVANANQDEAVRKAAESLAARKASKKTRIDEGINNEKTGDNEVRGSASSADSTVDSNAGMRKFSIGGNAWRALGIANDLVERGVGQLIGQSATTDREVAAIAQVYRDPRFETARFVLTRSGKVVFETGATARLPGATNFFPGGIKETATYLQDAMTRARADGYWLLHNHPSGDPTPSEADIRYTQQFAGEIGGFLGHVIINSNKFANIHEDGSGEVKYEDFGEDALLRASVPHKVLGAELKRPSDLAEVGKSFQSPGYVTLIGATGSPSKVRAVQSIDADNLDKASVRLFAQSSGSDSVFLYGTRDDIDLGMARNLLASGFIHNAMYEDGTNVASITGSQGFQVLTFGIEGIQGPKESGEGARFSGAANPIASDALPLISPLIQKLADGGGVVVHADASTLPGGKAPDGVQALTEADGTIHLVASSLTDANARAVLLHEAFHAGAEKLIGSPQWNVLLKRLGSLYRQGEQSSGKARVFFDAARRRVATAKAKGAVADGMEMEEFGAYAIEEYESAPLTIRKWVDDLVGFVKAWALKKFGKQLGQVSPAQLSALAKLALLDVRASREQSAYSVAEGAVAKFAAEMRAKYEGLRLDLMDVRSGAIHLSRVVVPMDGREQGIGTAFMTDLIRFADEQGRRITLTPSSDFGGNKTRLVKFYKRFGFVENKGRNKDFATMEAMYREPEAKPASRFSVSGAPQPPQQTFAPSEDGFLNTIKATLNEFQGVIQDNMNRVKQIQDRIIEQTGVRELGADFYLAWDNLPGRIASRKETFEKKILGPMMERLGKSGYTQDQLVSLMHAQHAAERNKKIREINVEYQHGSGMTDKRAAEILAQYPEDQHEKLHNIAANARQIARAALNMKLASGRIKQEDYDAIVNAYDFYVPLKGSGEHGPGMQRAMGHDEREEKILENITRDYEQALIASERNLAFQTLLHLVLQHPDDAIWTARVPPKGRRVVKEGGFYVVYKDGMKLGHFKTAVEAERQSELWAAMQQDDILNFEVEAASGEKVQEFVKPLQDHELMVYVKGDPVRIQLNDEKMAAQLRPMFRQKSGKIIKFFADAIRGLIRHFSVVYTGKNPYFILKNAVRDVITGTINITGNQGVVVMAKAWANYPKAWAAMLQFAATDNAPSRFNGDMGRHLQEYRMHGGKVGASYMSDLERQGKSLKRMFDDGKGVIGYAADGRVDKSAWIAARKTIGGLAHAVEVLNQAFENALRLALFATLRESGVKPGRAAQAAKTVTVNFDRRGSAIGSLGMAFLFINPAIQGTANMTKTLVKGEHKGQAWALISMVMSGGMFAAMAGMDDDEDRWLGERWDARTKNIRIRIGSENIVIPMSQEYAPFYAMGVAAGEVRRGQSPTKAAVNVLTSFVDAYYPMQGALQLDGDNPALDFMMAHVPTVVKFPAQVAVNRSSFGSKVVPESDNTKNRPDNLKMNRVTKGTIYDKAAQAIADEGYENDLSKVSPETLKAAWSTYTGGLGRFLADTGSLAMLAATEPEALQKTDFPFATDFVKPDKMTPVRSRFYDLSTEARKVIDEFTMANKMGDRPAVDAVKADKVQKHLAALGKMIKKVNETQAAYADKAVEINADKNLTTAQKRAELKKIEVEQEKMYREAIAAFKPK